MAEEVQKIIDRDDVKEIIEHYLVEKTLRQKFKGCLREVEERLKKVALDYAVEMFNDRVEQVRHECEMLHEYRRERFNLSEEIESLKSQALNLEMAIKRLKVERDKAKAEYDEAREPDSDNRCAIRLYERLNADAENERNPIVKAQRVRSNGLIIAARFGLKAIGGNQHIEQNEPDNETPKD
jgi:hypothetical protein